MADLISGAALGALVGALLTEVINAAKMAYHCKKNCKSLLSFLNSVSSLVEQVAKSADIGNDTCQAWLRGIHALLMETKSILEKCTLKTFSDHFKYVKRSKLSSQIMEIDWQIRMKLLESNLITLDIVQSIHQNMMKSSTRSPMVDSALDTRMQDIPNKAVAFVANPFDKLKSLIISATESMGTPMTIGLKGRGGVGKTLLAKMVNNDEDIRAKYGANSILWITIGQDATVPSLYSTMAKLFDGGDDYERDYLHRNLEDQHGYLIRAFRTKKILLILNDVWDHYPTKNCAIIEWLDIAKGLGSVTLVSTREKSVLKCAKGKEMVEVLSLSQDDSWKLFCINAFGSNKPPSFQIEKIARDICDEYKGLSLALKVIGSAMWDKDDERDWSNTSNNLKRAALMSNSKSMEKKVDNELFNQLQYSYNELDGDSKNCFLYFAAFPEDYEISTDSLCRIWHAEQLFGILNVKETTTIGRKILMDLASWSLIELFDDGNIAKIHDVLRDLMTRIIYKVKPNEWAFECYFQPGKVFGTFPMIKKTIKIVSLIGCNIHELPNNLELPYLQVCLISKISCIHDQRQFVIPKGFFSNMNHLQFLNLVQACGNEGMLFNFEELNSLTYLDLSGCSSLKELSESIKDLKSLMHLDMSECFSLKELLETIKDLECFTHLDLSRYTSLNELPKGIKNLKSLTYLYLIRCTSLKELPKNIKDLKSLIHLDLSKCKYLEELLESIKDLKSLMYLILFSCASLQELPESIKDLNPLTHLNLSWYYSLKELLQSIKDLKSLTHLDLSGCFPLKNFQRVLQS